LDQGSFQSVSTGVLIRGALAKLEKPLRENGAEVTYGDMPRVRGNPDALMQLFEQLLRNTIDHRGEAAPRVHISAAKADGCLQFAVQDRGPGVEAGELERIFRPFEHLHGSGPGLGLATCRAIVEGHGGKIWAESPASEGCAILFTLADAL
jgi:signal transduction histidine kinase